MNNQGQEYGMEGLLALAENLQRSIEEMADTLYGKRLQMYGLAIVGIIASFTPIFTVTIINPLSYNGAAFIIAVVTSVGLLTIVFVNLIRLIRQLDRLNKRLERDREAFSSIVELIRETTPFLMEKDEWSFLEQAQYKIRISRLEI